MSSDLSKEAAELVQAGRSALQPTNADKVRVRRALEAQLSLGGAPQAFTDGAGGAGGASSLGKLLLGAAGAATLITATVLLWPEAPTEPSGVVAPTQSDAIAQPLPNENSATPPDAPAPDLVPPPAEVVPAPATPTPRTKQGSDRLREEVELLTRAQKEFQAKRLRQTLALIDEHQRKFPSGALVQERVTLRTRVLCAMDSSACDTNSK